MAPQPSQSPSLEAVAAQQSESMWPMAAERTGSETHSRKLQAWAWTSEPAWAKSQICLYACHCPGQSFLFLRPSFPISK